MIVYAVFIVGLNIVLWTWLFSIIRECRRLDREAEAMERRLTGR